MGLVEVCCEQAVGIPLVEVMHATEVVLQISRQILQAVQVVLQVERRGRHFCPQPNPYIKLLHFSENQEKQI